MVSRPTRYIGLTSRKLQLRREPHAVEVLDLIRERRTFWMPGLAKPELWERFRETPISFKEAAAECLLFSAVCDSFGTVPAANPKEPLVDCLFRPLERQWTDIAGPSTTEEARQVAGTLISLGGVALQNVMSNMQLVWFSGEVRAEAAAQLPANFAQEYGPPQPIFLRPYSRTL